MFDIGWSEMLVIVALAVVVVGPRDIPKVVRTVGQWIGKARSLARDFQGSLEDMAREAELDELKKTVTDAVNVDVKKQIEDAFDPTGSLDGALNFPTPNEMLDRHSETIAEPSQEAGPTGPPDSWSKDDAEPETLQTGLTDMMPPAADDGEAVEEAVEAAAAEAPEPDPPADDQQRSASAGQASLQP